MHLHYNLKASEFYTVIASTFKPDQMPGGTITFESDQPLILRELPAEGHGLKKLSITDEWSYLSAGGCQNFGLYDRNPIFALNV